ncbi:MAG: PEGA domain-containing protein [Deltaproteobacteria bacterium]|nr:PEGA domain-containing protein [Deltaproteobacteria bacterium]
MAYRNLFGFACFGLVTLAVAAAPAPASADENSMARVYFEQGNEALTRGMNARGPRKTRFLQQALESYMQSLQIVRTRNVVYNAGVALEGLERDDEAFGYFREYLEFPNLSAEEQAEATTKLTALRQRVAVVMIVSTPPGAEVRIDRRDLAVEGTTPLEVAVSAGNHRIFVSAEGYVDGEATVMGATGRRERVAVELNAEPIALVIHAEGVGTVLLDGHPVDPSGELRVMPGEHVIRFGDAPPIEVTLRPGEGRREVRFEAPQNAPTGMLAVSTNVDDASVFVDGEILNTGRELETSVASGPRTIRIEAPGYAPATRRVDVPANGEARLTVQLEVDVGDETRFGKLPGVLWLSAGVIGLGAAGTGIAAVVANNNFDDNPSTPGANQVETLNTAADILFGVTAAVGIAALIFTLLNREVEQPPSAIEVAGAPVEGGAMLMASGTWGGQ